MTDGGLFAWKIQKIDEHRGPAAKYESIKNPLPHPPKGKVWVQDLKTREWSLEDELPVMLAEVTAIEEQDGEILLDKEEDEDKDKKQGIRSSTTRRRFMEHVIQPTDTFQGLCLRYKVTPTELRRANCFSGSNLLLAPNPLKIPLVHGVVQVAQEVLMDGQPPSKDDMVYKLRMQCGADKLAKSEAKCYLELNDWNYNEALQNAREDLANEK